MSASNSPIVEILNIIIAHRRIWADIVVDEYERATKQECSCLYLLGSEVELANLVGKVLNEREVDFPTVQSASEYFVQMLFRSLHEHFCLAVNARYQRFSDKYYLYLKHVEAHPELTDRRTVLLPRPAELKNKLESMRQLGKVLISRTSVSMADKSGWESHFKSFNQILQFFTDNIKLFDTAADIVNNKASRKRNKIIYACTLLGAGAAAMAIVSAIWSGMQVGQ